MRTGSIVAAVALAGGLCVAVITSQGGGDVTAEQKRATDSAAKSHAPVARAGRRRVAGAAADIEVEAPPDGAAAVAIVAPEQGQGEDPISARWDALSGSQRVQALRTELDEAISELERGNNVPRNLSRAETALSSLRPELYASDSGRALHLALEANLDALSDRLDARESASPKNSP